MAKRNLVYVRAGDNSLHSSWAVSREKRNYDLFVSYFGNNPGTFQGDGEYYEAASGLKFPALVRLLKEKPELIYSYDAIWIPDDDLLTSAERINRMFELFHKYKLQLAQPALAPGSYLAHPITAMIKQKSLHFSRYVEVMCPIFSRFALKKLAHTFSLNASSWGIDFAWGSELAYPARRIAVLDETPVLHTRPIGKGSFYDALKGKKVSPEAESLKIIRKYKLSEDWAILRKRVFGTVRWLKTRLAPAGDWTSLHFLQEMLDKECKTPIFYENRAGKLKLKDHERPSPAAFSENHANGNPNGANHSRTSELKRSLSSPRRLEAIAKDVIKQWAERQKLRAGKAMLVCTDPEICSRLCAILGRLRPEWKKKGVFAVATNWGDEGKSGEARAQLITRFQDPRDPLQLIVTDSLELPEFHVPILNTLYMDVPKPVEQHHYLVGHLMRIFQKRLATLVVDYVGLSEVMLPANGASARQKLAPVETSPGIPLKAASSNHNNNANGRARTLRPVRTGAPMVLHRSSENGILKAGRRIAHLFLIRKGLNHEKIWKNFFKGYDDYYNIYVHAKEPEHITSRLLQGKHISSRCETRYGHVSLVKAELLLLEEALENHENEFFLLHSESCVPIRSFDFVYHRLFGMGRSWLYAFKGDMWRYYGLATSAISHRNFFKCSQFFCLTREHAQAVLHAGKLEHWENSECPDEHYFPTTLAMSGKLDECLRQPLTFTDWNLNRREGGWGPTTYHELSPADLKNLMRTECLFARKFAPDSDISTHIEKLYSRPRNRTLLRNNRQVPGVVPRLGAPTLV